MKGVAGVVADKVVIGETAVVVAKTREAITEGQCGGFLVGGAHPDADEGRLERALKGGAERGILHNGGGWGGT